MEAVLTILVKFILCSGVLMGFYLLMYRNKSSYTSARIFLLLLPAVSLLLSTFVIRIPAEWLPGNPVVLTENVVAPDASESVATVAAVDDVAATAAVVATKDADVKQILTEWLPLILLALYLFVALIYQLAIVRHLRRINRIRAVSEKERCSGYTVCTSIGIESPFSVMRGIYMPREYDADKYSLILTHERQHIRHRHYVDMMLIEMMTVIFWFNPAIWLIRRELRAIHEFQADDSILRSGVNQLSYMLTILEETAGSIPSMANGFNSSLIKKRFMKMKDGNHIKLRGIRAVLSVGLLAALMLVFSCRVTRDTPRESQAERLAKMDWTDYRTVNLTYSEADGKYYTPDGVEKCWCENCQKNAEKFKTKYLSHDDVKIVTGYRHSEKPSRLVRIETDRKETRVTFVVEIYWDSNWLHGSEGTYLWDRETGDKYMVRDIEGGQEIGRMNVVTGLKGQFVEQTMIFPPLKKGVKVVDFREPDNYGDEALPDNGTNSGGKRIRGIVIADYAPENNQGRILR